MNESCKNCKWCLDIDICDYSKGGCTHIKVPDEFICLAFQDEGLACVMRGLDRAAGMCEAWTPKETKL